MTLLGCGTGGGGFNFKPPGGQAVTKISLAMRGVRFLAPSAAIAALALLAAGGLQQWGQPISAC
jgi:hypothetical protein